MKNISDWNLTNTSLCQIFKSGGPFTVHHFLAISTPGESFNATYYTIVL